MVKILPGRRPTRDVAAHGHEDKAETAHWFGRRFCEDGRGRNHGIEQWERQRGAHAAQKRSSWKSFFRYDHNDSLIVNGVLLANPTMIAEKR